MSTQSNPILVTETGSQQARKRGFQPGNVLGRKFEPGISPNPAGRPKGLFSRRTLRQARKRGVNGLTGLDEVVAALFDKAKGAPEGKNASLEAIGFLRDTIDGPLDKGDLASGGAQVMVIVQDVSNGAKVVESQHDKV